MVAGLKLLPQKYFEGPLLVVGYKDGYSQPYLHRTCKALAAIGPTDKVQAAHVWGHRLGQPGNWNEAKSGKTELEEGQFCVGKGLCLSLYLHKNEYSP